MAQIPGIPTLDPIDKPYMNPREAGKPGAAISEAGDRGVDAAISGLDMLGHIREAQKNVDETASKNEQHAAFLEFQSQLEKTNDSRNIPAVIEQFHDKMNDINKRWSNSPAAITIQMNGDYLNPEADTHGTLRQITLMRNEQEINVFKQSDILAGDYANGNRDAATAAFNEVVDKSRSLFGDAVADEKEHQFQIKGQILEIQNGITNANPEVNTKTYEDIEQHPEKYPDVTKEKLDVLKGQALEAFEAHTKQKDWAEGQMALKTMLVPKINQFTNPATGHFDEGAALTDNADRMAKGEITETQAGVLAQGFSSHAAQLDVGIKDEAAKKINTVDDLLDKKQFKAAQKQMADDENWFEVNGLSADHVNELRYMNSMESQLRAEATAARSANTTARQLADQERKEKSQEAAADLTLRIARGEVPSDADIKLTPNLSKADQAYITTYRDKAKADRPYQGGMTIISSAYAVTSKMTPVQKGQQQEYYLRTMQAYDQEINAHPEEDKSVIASKLVMPGIVRNAIMDSVPGMAGPIKPSMWQRMRDATQPARDLIYGQPSPSSQGGAPTQSDTPKTIRVKEKSTGRMGTIPASEYDPQVYEKVQ